MPPESRFSFSRLVLCRKWINTRRVTSEKSILFDSQVLIFDSLPLSRSTKELLAVMPTITNKLAPAITNKAPEPFHLIVDRPAQHHHLMQSQSKSHVYTLDIIEQHQYVWENAIRRIRSGCSLYETIPFTSSIFRQTIIHRSTMLGWSIVHHGRSTQY